jgi:hypothetical protein
MAVDYWHSKTVAKKPCALVCVKSLCFDPWAVKFIDYCTTTTRYCY